PVAHGLRTYCGALGQAPLAALFTAHGVVRTADGLLPGDVPAVPIGRHRRDLTHPAGSPGRIFGDSPKSLRPGLSALDSLDCHDAGARFHGVVTLSERTGHFGVGDTACPGNEPRDVVVSPSTTGPGCPGPAVHPRRDGRRDVSGTFKGAAADQSWQGGL